MATNLHALETKQLETLSIYAELVREGVQHIQELMRLEATPELPLSQPETTPAATPAANTCHWALPSDTCPGELSSAVEAIRLMLVNPSSYTLELRMAEHRRLRDMLGPAVERAIARASSLKGPEHREEER